MCVCVCVRAHTHVFAKSLQSHLTFCYPMDCQAPLSMGFSRQEYWSGLLCPSPGNLPNPGIEPASPEAPALQVDSLPPSNRRNPYVCVCVHFFRFFSVIDYYKILNTVPCAMQ